MEEGECLVSFLMLFLDMKNVSSLQYPKQICSLAVMSHLSMCHLCPAHAVLFYFNSDDNAGIWHLLACSDAI